MATTIAGAHTRLVLWSFPSGGVLDATPGHGHPRAGFFAACGTHFWRSSCGLRAAWSLGALRLCTRALRRPVSMGDATRCDRGVRALSAPASRRLQLVFDYARIRIVVEDRRSAVGAFVAGARFVRRHPATLKLYLLNGACFVLLALVYALAAPGAPAGQAIWIAFAVGQLYILLRHYVKLLFYASQVSFFQSRLAHAAYTAAPPVVWPDSPAAESIGNASA
jgi:hypothetical protein